MTVTAANLLVKVKADTSSAQSGLSGLLGLMGSVGGGLAVGAVAAGAAIVGIGAASLKMAGDFQAGMTSLVTGAGESQKNLKLVSDGVLKMATDTGTSTSQLTDGMYMIESAGYHGAAGLKVLQAAAEGAKVGNADLGTVADATTTILKDYPNVMNGANGAVNTLVATVASGKTHMADLSSSLAQVLPTASAAHVGLNDIMAAMATMTAEGVPAANAATYLRQTIIGLDAPGKAAQKALESVGLSSSQVSAEMQKSLPGALEMITDAVGKKFPVGSAGYVNALKDIMGGSKQLQGVLDLTGSHMNELKGNVSNISDAVKKGGNSINGWSDIQGDFNQKMDRAGQVVQTLMIQLGEHLLPVAGQVVDLFTSDTVPALNAVTGGIQRAVQIGQGLVRFFQDTGPASTAVKVALVVLTGALLGMAASAIPAAVVAVGASVTAFGAQAVAAGAAAVATLAAAAPFILIGAAFAAVVAIIVLAVTHWKDITQTIQNFIGWIQQAPTPIKILVGILALPLAPIIAIIAAIILLKNHWGDVMTFMGNALHAVVGIAQAVGGVIGAAIKGGINLVISDIDTFIRVLDAVQIHVPSISAGPVHTPAFDWNGLQIPKIPLLAQGGVITSPGQVIVGDAGPELLSLPAGATVTPLPSGAQTASGAPMTIILQVDGRTLAQIVTKYQPGVIRQATGTRAF